MTTSREPRHPRRADTTRAGGDPRAVQRAVDEAVAKLPKVSGGDGQVYVDPSLVRVLDEAEKLAKKAGDSFVTVERLLLALAMEKSAKASEILANAGVTANALNAAINEIRKGRTADSASAEQGYDALKRYARDLTKDAREGRLDPVIGLVPVVGDAVGTVVAAAVFAEAVRNRIPVHLLFRMGWNYLVDAALGVVPLVGDVADVAHKATSKNLRLVDRAIAEGRPGRREVAVSAKYYNTAMRDYFLIERRYDACGHASAKPMTTD